MRAAFVANIVFDEMPRAAARRASAKTAPTILRMLLMCLEEPPASCSFSGRRFPGDCFGTRNYFNVARSISREIGGCQPPPLPLRSDRDETMDDQANSAAARPSLST